MNRLGFEPAWLIPPQAMEFTHFGGDFGAQVTTFITLHETFLEVYSELKFTPSRSLHRAVYNEAEITLTLS